MDGIAPTYSSKRCKIKNSTKCLSIYYYYIDSNMDEYVRINIYPLTKTQYNIYEVK